MNVIFKQFSESFYYFHLGPNASSATFSNNLLCSSANVKDYVSHPLKTSYNYTLVSVF
jgi:hypothetical protein